MSPVHTILLVTLELSQSLQILLIDSTLVVSTLIHVYWSIHVFDFLSFLYRRELNVYRHICPNMFILSIVLNNQTLFIEEKQLV